MRPAMTTRNAVLSVMDSILRLNGREAGEPRVYTARMSQGRRSSLASFIAFRGPEAQAHSGNRPVAEPIPQGNRDLFSAGPENLIAGSDRAMRYPLDRAKAT